MPYALSEIRAFADGGHVVHASDTFASAPGNHSNGVTMAHETVSPKADPAGYARQIEGLVEQFAVDLVLPMFEEVFPLAKFRNCDRVDLFAPGFQALERLHDKAQFLDLASELGMPMPPTMLCTNVAEMREAMATFGQYFARAVYSRAGLGIATNAEELPRAMDLTDVLPTEDSPWIVQPFTKGTEVCSFSVVRHGRIVAHTTYVHPKTLDGTGGIEFETIVDDEVLQMAAAICEKLGYHGQISFDFMRTTSGELHLVECNPRPTAGVCMMEPEVLVAAVLGEFDDTQPQVTRAGERRVIRAALLRDMIVQPRHFLENWKSLTSDVQDLYFAEGDSVPGIYQSVSAGHIAKSPDVEGGRGKDLAAGFLDDLCWDGSGDDHSVKRVSG